MERIVASDLSPGDLWVTGLDNRFWILVQKEELKEQIDETVFSVWKMTWFGKKGQGDMGLICDSWIDGSSFKILSRGEK